MSKKFNLTHYCLSNSTRRFPSKSALIYVDCDGHNTELTYRELYNRIAGVATGVSSLGIPPGKNITLHLPKGLDFISLYFAAISAGLVPIPGWVNLSPADMKDIIIDSQSVLYAESKETKLAFDLPEGCRYLGDEELETLKSFRSDGLRVVTDYEDPAALFYTSGSTGRPKGVLHSHRMILGREPSRKYWLDLREDDVIIHTGRPCWTYAMGVGLMDPWVKGATAVVYGGSPEEGEIWFRLIEKYRITILATSSEFLRAMLKSRAYEDYDLSSVRHFVSAGDSLSDRFLDEWQEKVGITIYEALGMTEYSTFIGTGPTIPIKRGYIGKIQPNRKVDILPIEEASGGSVPVGEKGLLAIHKSDPGFMMAYYGDPENGRTRFRGEWFLSQDVVSQDDDGYIKYLGRQDDMFNTEGGVLISPLELERLFSHHEAVEEVGCGLTKSGDIENVLTLFVVPARGRKGVEKELMTWSEKQVSHFKRPRRIVVVDELPRTHTGKLDRKRLPKLADEQRE